MCSNTKKSENPKKCTILLIAKYTFLEVQRNVFEHN